MNLRPIKNGGFALLFFVYQTVIVYMLSIKIVVTEFLKHTSWAPIKALAEVS